MAKNDLILLDSIIETRIQEGNPSKEISEVFEFENHNGKSV